MIVARISSIQLKQSVLDEMPFKKAQRLLDWVNAQQHKTNSTTFKLPLDTTEMVIAKDIPDAVSILSKLLTQHISSKIADYGSEVIQFSICSGEIKDDGRFWTPNSEKWTFYDVNS
jgi:hypothetical protein